VIADQVDRLKKKGFSVETRRGLGLRPSVEIDTKRRKVTITASAGPHFDTLMVAGKTWRVKFSKWDITEGRYQACRIIGRQTIELNEEYPLFRGGNKDLFRRVQIILAHAENESGSKREFFEKVQALMLREFGS
jgi:hypothetical protein